MAPSLDGIWQCCNVLCYYDDPAVHLEEVAFSPVDALLPDGGAGTQSTIPVAEKESTATAEKK